MSKWTNEKVKSLRKELNLSQNKFGEHPGVTENYIYLLEFGQKTPGRILELLLDCVKKEKIE